MRLQGTSRSSFWLWLQRSRSSSQGCQRVMYRELMSFPDIERLDRIRSLLLGPNPNYHVRYFDFSHAGTPPLLQFHIVDELEVVLCVPARDEPRYLAIRDPLLAAILSHYFNAAWRDGEPLKDAAGPRVPLIDELTARLRDTSS